jgi:hypothetical protein
MLLTEWNLKKNLKVEPISKCVQNYCANWMDHIEGMDSNRVRNKLLHYRPHGRRSIIRPLERWSEIVTDTWSNT